jgi:DNA-directed RNA polymerase specialized sigma24 family protein
LLGINDELARDTARPYRNHGEAFQTQVWYAVRGKGLDLLLQNPACDPCQVHQQGFVPLLRKAMQHLAIDEHRKHRTVATLEGIEVENGPHRDGIVATVAGPERVVTARVDLERLMQALSRLLFDPAAAAIRQEAAGQGTASPTGEPLFRAWLRARFAAGLDGGQWSQKSLGESFAVSQSTVSRRVSEYKDALEKRMAAVVDEAADPARCTGEHLLVTHAWDNGLRRFLILGR